LLAQAQKPLVNTPATKYQGKEKPILCRQSAHLEQWRPDPVLSEGEGPSSFYTAWPYALSDRRFVGGGTQAVGDDAVLCRTLLLREGRHCLVVSDSFWPRRRKGEKDRCSSRSSYKQAPVPVQKKYWGKGPIGLKGKGPFGESLILS